MRIILLLVLFGFSSIAFACPCQNREVPDSAHNSTTTTEQILLKSNNDATPSQTDTQSTLNKI